MAELTVKQAGKVVSGVKATEMKYVTIEHATGAMGKWVPIDDTEVDVTEDMIETIKAKAVVMEL